MSKFHFIAFLLSSGVVLAASAAPFPAQPVQYNFVADSTATAGWQKPYFATIAKTAAPEGVINYSCPSKYPVAISGSETFDADGDKDTIDVISDGLKVSGNKTLTDTWSFYLRWPAGHLRSKETIAVNVYCAAK